MVPSRVIIRTSLLALVFVLLLTGASPVFGAVGTPFAPGMPFTSEMEFALTGEATGWLRSDDRLFRTQSNGSDWQDVTPSISQSESLVDVAFLDSNQALTLTVSAGPQGWQLALTKTADFGLSWQVQPVTLPTGDRNYSEVPFGDASIQWQNNGNGWILVKQATSPTSVLVYSCIRSMVGKPGKLPNHQQLKSSYFWMRNWVLCLTLWTQPGCIKRGIAAKVGRAFSRWRTPPQ